MGDDAATVEQLRAELRQSRELRTADQAEMASLRAELERHNAELQASNRQVSEALEQQTATAEVLRVIASSPTDPNGVLRQIVDSATRLCRAGQAVILQAEGTELRWAASSIGAQGSQPFDMQYRITRPNGEERWLQVKSRRVFDDASEHVGYVGTTEDITDRRSTELALLHSEERFRTIAESSPVGIFLADRRTDTTYTNPRFDEILAEARKQ